MEIENPQWALKTQRCLYCDEGELIFSRCPSCKVIILICEECGTAYEIDHQEKIGKEVGDITGATRCQRCGDAFQHEFPPASSDEIQALGFTPKDYQ